MGAQHQTILVNDKNEAMVKGTTKYKDIDSMNFEEVDNRVIAISNKYEFSADLTSVLVDVKLESGHILNVRFDTSSYVALVHMAAKENETFAGDNGYFWYGIEFGFVQSNNNLFYLSTSESMYKSILEKENVVDPSELKPGSKIKNKFSYTFYYLGKFYTEKAKQSTGFTQGKMHLFIDEDGRIIPFSTADMKKVRLIAYNEKTIAFTDKMIAKMSDPEKYIGGLIEKFDGILEKEMRETLSALAMASNKKEFEASEFSKLASLFDNEYNPIRENPFED